MKMKKYAFELGNFTCFYHGKELLDCFEENVFPIFRLKLKRERGETYQLQFMHIRLSVIAGHPCLSGRLIKRMKIRARQRVKKDEEQLASTEDTMLSDPSSIFFLRLSDHRLFIVKEIPRAPDINNLKKVVDALLFERWWATYQKAFLQHKKKLKKLRLSKVERQEFENTYTASFPEPAVRITSVSDKFAATEAIAPFKIIKSVSYTALKTNNEDADGEEALLKLHREFMAKLNGTSADMGFENAADGLDKEKVEDLVIAASASAGNAEYVVRGNAVDGSSLRITEDDSRVKLDVKVPADATVTDLGAAIFRKLDDAILSGTIKINTSNAVKTERERATELIRKINRGQR